MSQEIGLSFAEISFITDLTEPFIDTMKFMLNVGVFRNIVWLFFRTFRVFIFLLLLQGFNTYSKTKWKGSELKIQVAKDNFLERYLTIYFHPTFLKSKPCWITVKYHSWVEILKRKCFWESLIPQGPFLVPVVFLPLCDKSINFSSILVQSHQFH